MGEKPRSHLPPGPHLMGTLQHWPETQREGRWPEMQREGRAGRGEEKSESLQIASARKEKRIDLFPSHESGMICQGDGDSYLIYLANIYGGPIVCEL